MRRGTLAYNLVLGEKRAKAVRNYLVELGVGANRLSVVSYGKSGRSATSVVKAAINKTAWGMWWSGRNNCSNHG